MWLALLMSSGCEVRPRPSQSIDELDRIWRPVAKPYRGDPASFDNPQRDRELLIEQTMEVLGIGPGKVVADIGAGSGYFTFHAARRVGAEGLVYAVDIEPRMLAYIRKRAAREKVFNVRTILSEENDPKLPPAAVDVAMILKTYHEIASPVALLRRVRLALKPGARLAIIDQDSPKLREQARWLLAQKPAQAQQPPASTDEHMVAREFVISEARRAGFQLLAECELPGEQNYLLWFGLAAEHSR